MNRIDKRETSSKKALGYPNNLENIPCTLKVRRKGLLQEGKVYSTNRILTNLSIRSSTSQMSRSEVNYPRVEAKSMKVSGKRVTVARGRTRKRSTKYRSKWYMVEGKKHSYKKVPLWHGLLYEMKRPLGVKAHSILRAQRAKKVGH